ncbi:MAG: hypothetical protein ACYDAK_13730, partial [Candidatus Limnocylindrales bacterium]
MTLEQGDDPRTDRRVAVRVVRGHARQPTVDRLQVAAAEHRVLIRDPAAVIALEEEILVAPTAELARPCGDLAD